MARRSYVVALLLASNLVPPVTAQDLSVTIEAPAYPIHVHAYTEFSVRITNTGKRAAILTMPGDGSESGWRTPLVGWSILPAQDAEARHPELPPRNTEGRCGHVNSIGRDEVFVLNPGECRALADVAGPWFPQEGRYRVVFYYQNLPALKPGGAPFAPHDPTALALMQRSTPCLLRSNELQVSVLPSTLDSVKESKTRARLGEWSSHFLRYHRANKRPARSLLEVFKAAFPTWHPLVLANVFQVFSKDEWGTGYVHAYELAGDCVVLVTVSSAGPDRKIGTGDDLSVATELKLERK